jgi:hypothetical protein
MKDKELREFLHIEHDDFKKLVYNRNIGNRTYNTYDVFKQLFLEIKSLRDSNLRLLDYLNLEIHYQEGVEGKYVYKKKKGGKK